MGALAIAKKLPVPWALWLAVDDSTVEAWSAELTAAPNIHLVRVTRSGGEVATDRRRRPKPWAVNTFTRYCLLDDPGLAGAVVLDLDVEGQAALDGLKLWRSTDASLQPSEDIVYGVVRYGVPSARGMEGTKTTWNGGSVAMVCRLHGDRERAFTKSINDFIKDDDDVMMYGCDEKWLGSASPVYFMYKNNKEAVYEVEDTSPSQCPILPSVPSRPQAHPFRFHDLSSRMTERMRCTTAVQEAVASLNTDPTTSHLRQVHALLTHPFSSTVAVDWVHDNTARHQ